MALFGLSKDKKGGNPSEQVLAYLEEALRRRTPFLLQDAKAREGAGNLVGIDEEQGTATFSHQGEPTFSKGDQVTPVFMVDGLRIGSPCKCVAVRPGQVEVALPENLAILERRKQPRARLNPKEGATLTALTGLFEGIGLTGVIENICEGGARVRVDRAMEAKGEKKLSPHVNLLPKGHAFDLIKVSKLPKISGVYELSGKVAYLEGGSGGLIMGVAFKSFPPEALNALRALVSGRVTSAPSTLPHKTRRAAEPEAPPERREAPPAAEPAPPPVPKEPAPAAKVQPPEPPPPPAPAEAPTGPPVARNLALLRLKKRSRSLLVAAPGPNAELGRLMASLQADGYGRVLFAASLGGLLGALDEPNLGLLIIDGGVAELEGLDLVGTLHNVREKLPPILLAMEAPSAEDVVAARQTGVDHLLVKPFPPDEDLSCLLENLLGL